jgi:hypothetical protein
LVYLNNEQAELSLTLPFYFIAGVQERQLLMLATDNSVVLIIDVQGKLAHLMHDKEILFNNN